MNLIQRLMGRRQFLVGAGVASASALAYKKLAGVVDPVTEIGAAMASEKPAATGMKGVFSDRYSHLLSPLRIRNVVLKNRMMQNISYPRLLMGPETFPSEQIINHYANVAKNGCAIVCCFSGDDIRSRKGLNEEARHMGMWDLEDTSVQHYFSQLIDGIHFYGSIAAIVPRGQFRDLLNSGNGAPPQGGGQAGEAPGGADGKTPPEGAARGGAVGGPGRTSANDISVEAIQKMYEGAATQAKFWQSLGFDMVYFRIDWIGGFLSSKTNNRTDRYGGSLENRARVNLELFQTIKKACGQDFLIGGYLAGEGEDDGYTSQDVGEFAKVWEDSLDILMIRGKGANESHPSGYTFKKVDNPMIRYSRAVKESGTKMVIAVNGGFQDLDLNEEYIATGKTDLICMARAWYADPEYGKKAYEGRGEDVVPCIRCAECHGPNEGPWYSVCPVNPKFGIAHKLDQMIDAPVMPRKVAVIGGGPAGMKAAVTAAERGHKVTLYEKNDYLGGQLRHADFASFQWPIKDFKDYLIRQVNKSGIEVLLNTKATPEMIKANGYDAVIIAAGAEPIIPDIPGAKGSNVRPPIFVFGNEKALGKNVVVIGGDQIGTQTGMHLAEKGHKVTMLTTDKTLAADASIYVNQGMMTAYEPLKAQGTFSYITEVTATGISEGKVTYKDAKGNEKSIQADSVVIYAGRKPRMDEAMKFSGCARQFFIIGDCNAHGNVRTHWDANIWTSTRTALAAAAQI